MAQFLPRHADHALPEVFRNALLDLLLHHHLLNYAVKRFGTQLASQAQNLASQPEVMRVGQQNVGDDNGTLPSTTRRR